ncbi:MAG: TRAP transporter small permease [Pseudomonadota bacterium]
MKRVLDLLSRASLAVSAACIVAMTLIISYQVVARYVFNDSPAWSERLSLLLLAYLVFFGAATGVHEKFHIRIDALRNAMSPPIAKAFDIAAHVAVAGAGLIMLLAGFDLTMTLWGFSIPALGLPRGLALLPVMIAGALITLFSMAHLLNAATSRDGGAD